MKTVRAILWVQIALGLVGGYIAFAYIHWGGMSAVWAYNLQVEHDKMKQSPEYREPAPIRDQSLSKILDDMQAYGRARADVAGYWLLTCGALVVLAVVSLVLLRPRRMANQTLQATPAKPENSKHHSCSHARLWRLCLSLVTMRRVLIMAGVVIVLVVVWGVAFTGTPLFGRSIALKDAPVSSIELSISMRREITASNLCAQVIQTMRKARDGGPVHVCPSLGTLIIHYADGTTNCFALMPGHRFNRLDMVDISGSSMYSISTGEMFRTLERVGLMTREP
jgi:hypothetical protein